MNIIVADSWLREFLETKATAKDIQQYLSLSGPSVERVNKIGSEIVYDIEITSNRPDSMSILGIAREASAILPRFGIPAKLANDPYNTVDHKIPGIKGIRIPGINGIKKLNIKTDPKLNPRWSSIVLTNINVGPSPKWLKEKLEVTGIRSLNNIVDITNYLMRAYGQPAHAFDYDEVQPGKNGIKNGIPTMILRASKKGEQLTTLDGKTHVLPGDDIVIEDGSGRLIDLCGIMGAENSAIKPTTKTVVLFLQTYDPAHIRRTSMKLGHRTEAASLFEKGLDAELVLPALMKGTELVKEIAGGIVASKIYDIYPVPFKPYSVSVSERKLTAYLGIALSNREIVKILTSLGFSVSTEPNKAPKQGSTLTQIAVSVPSFRRDISIDVDIIEEIARIYGYHNISTKLPEGELPVVMPDKELNWEEKIKVRLRDWGFTELLTYSMISDKLMDIFDLDKSKAYKISNPLSEEWIYMRPHLFPSVLENIKQNLNIKKDLKLFELSMSYHYRANDLPDESPTLVVVWAGDHFRSAKGLAEAIFQLFGIPFPQLSETIDHHTLKIYGPKHLLLGEFGSLGVLEDSILSKMSIATPVTGLYLDFAKLVAQAHPTKKYIPIPKYPASFEDLAFIVPPQTAVGPMIDALKRVDALVADVSLLDTFENVRTFHITYQSKIKNLTADDVKPIREKLLKLAGERFGAQLKIA